MYIVIEGMPGTGKTTLAKALANKLNATYMKSIFSNTEHGGKIRKILNKGLNKEVEPFYIVDLLLDELRLQQYLRAGDVVRDKVYASSLAHLRAHGFENTEESVTDALYGAYLELSSLSVEPDYVIYLQPVMSKVIDHLYQKGDLSAIDIKLTSNLSLYEKQQLELENELRCKYGDKLHCLESFFGSIDDMVKQILSDIGKEEIEQ